MLFYLYVFVVPLSKNVLRLHGMKTSDNILLHK